MIRAYRGIVPRIAASAYIDQSAQVIGDVVVGERSSIWANATARGDVNEIRIGDDSNIQDNSVLHCDSGFPLHIGCLLYTSTHRIALVQLNGLLDFFFAGRPIPIEKR